MFMLITNACYILIRFYVTYVVYFLLCFFSFHTHITLTLHCSNLRIILGLHTFELRNKDSFFQYFEMIKYGWVIRSNKA